MSKPSSLGLTWEDVQKELDSWTNSSEKRKTIDMLDENQKRILCGLMRSGKTRESIVKWWKGKGYPGASLQTMRRTFKELQEQGY